MELLIFFAMPLATILLSIVLERIFKCPIYVVIFLFAIYLIGVFIFYATGLITDLGTAMVALIIYTIISFITAYLFSIFSIFNENNGTIANNGTQSLATTGDVNTLNSCNRNEENLEITDNIPFNNYNVNRPVMIRGRCRR